MHLVLEWVPQIASFSKRFCLVHLCMWITCYYIRGTNDVIIERKTTITETDHIGFERTDKQVVQTPDQHYYLSKQLGDNHIILYKPGKSNKVANTLSRCNSPFTSQLLLLNIPAFDFLNTFTAMDFIVSVPAYHGNGEIMLVTCRFSKAAHFGSLATNFVACKAVELIQT